MRIALFGGSFDPIHLGHLLVARAALEQLDLDQLCFIPAAQSPFKPGQPPAPPEARLRLLRTALAGWTRCTVDPAEVHAGGISYTVETVQRYHRLHPGARLFYLIGADHLRQLHRWRDASRLAELVEFAVLPRPGESDDTAHPPFTIHTLSGVTASVSSSLVRQRIRARQPVELLVGPAVAESLQNSGLYL